MNRRASLLLLALPAWLLSCRQGTTVPSEVDIEQRQEASKGIFVGDLKVYDNSVLQQMLAAAEARLATLQLIDQTGISARIGSVTGGSQQISGLALSALGTPTPQSVLTANGATGQVVSTVTASGTGSQTVSTVSTSGAPVQNTVTTMPQVTASAPTVMAPTTTLPSAFSGSASDILDEQMQLTYEIANLRLLLEGSLNDRLLQLPGPGQHQWLTKPKVTLGFPVTLTPDKRYRNAAAVVEVEVETAKDANLTKSGAPPTVLALLPQDKTYNVAAIKDKSTNIGAGVVTKVATIGGSYQSGQKSYYIVKDQDTVAVPFQPKPSPNPSDPQRVGFSWQFRPVLGNEYVQAGLKQVFVQLSFPSPPNEACFGKAYVRTYWRAFDSSLGLPMGIVPQSLRPDYPPADIPGYNLTQDVSKFSPQNLEDLGGGQMLVRVPGQFLSGTAIRIGSTVLQQGAAGFSLDSNQLMFTAAIADLATKAVCVVSGDGSETPLRIFRDVPNTADKPAFKLDPPTVTVIDETNSLLRIKADPMNPVQHLPLVMVIGGKVYGYSDAPIDRAPIDQTAGYLSVAIPTATLFANPEVTVKALLADDRYFCMKRTIFAPGDASERLALLQQTPDSLIYVFYGRNLGNLQASSPPGSNAKVALAEIGDGQGKDRVRFLTVDLASAKNIKQLVFQRPGERPFAIPLPQLPAQTGAQPLKFSEPVTVGADDATLVGDGLKDIVKLVTSGKTLTTLALSADGNSLKVTGLAAAGITATAETVACDLVTQTGSKTTVQLQVVNSKVASVAG